MAKVQNQKKRNYNTKREKFAESQGEKPFDLVPSMHSRVIED